MSEPELNYENFLANVSPFHQEYVNQLHAGLLNGGCKFKLQLAKNGYVASYSYGKSKRVVLNFVFRKNALMARIYGDNAAKYAGFLETLPGEMVTAIGKAGDCRSCNSRCPQGYTFSIGETAFNKCRYGCFMFPLSDESFPYIKTFVENEIKERSV